ncbi:MAG: PAS domain S-box protein [Theionarchaea archaeon]|nr:PAS domain S-box protein [Theionarchaea archaeon]MBU6999159.1 PAS domain S-box protein [Theionarchaea archaeon]MBU7019520.1 PAS domain S-box protein [Theionarchaea archaeon]MBU7040957.1 PAS domain S-box protein [Theionarchaea archaeon]
MNLLLARHNLREFEPVERALEGSGHRINVVEDGREALRCVREEPVDCVVSTLFLPGLDGFQLCMRIKEDDTLKKTRVVFYSESMNAQEERLAYSAGADLLVRTSDCRMIVSQIRDLMQTDENSLEKSQKTDFWQEYSLLLKESFDRLVQKLEKSEKRLSESEIRYRVLFEGSHDATFILNTDGINIAANKRAEELLGYPREELEGRSFRDIVTEPSIKNAEEKLKQLLAGKSMYEYERNIKTKDGATIAVEVSLSVIKDESEEVLYIQSIVRDITERMKMEEKLRESEEKYRTLVENLNVGVYRVSPDEDGHFIEVNESCAKILGFDEKEDVLKLKVVDMYANPHDREKYRNEVFSWGYVKEKELVLRRRDGTLMITSDTATCVYDDEGNPLYIDGILEDITERKKAEKTLKAYSARLEREVTERTKELRDAQEELIRKGKLAVLGQLASIVGHELRNPLGVIGNSTYFLKMKLQRADDIVIKHLGIIDQNVERASTIIEELLGFSRTRKPRNVPTNINMLVRDALTSLRIPDTIQVKYDLDETVPLVEADPEHLRRVFINLLTNAVQAMAEGGTLTLKTGCTEDITIAIQDTGQGIPEEYSTRIFEPLFTTRARGIGLGLVIAKNIIEEHNGTITVVSNVGEGTLCMVKLPLPAGERNEE